MTLLHTLMETCATFSQKVAHLEQDKVAQALEITKLKQRVKKLERKRRSKHSGLKRLQKVGGKIAELDVDEDVTLVDMDTAVEMNADIQVRMEDDVTAVKEINVAEPTVFDDEEMQDKHLDNIKKYQNLKRKPIYVAQARKNMIVYLKNMAGYKMQHFKGMPYDQVRPIFEREYNSVQTFLKSDRDEEPTNKRAAKETMLQESFKNLRAEVNILDMLKDFDREDLDALWRLVKERSSTTLPTTDKQKALWDELTRLYKPTADDVFWKL
uniref:Uncharacterized protein n=1 Tax=Tanacetum cinerariifolium TaxID=118510 RepID=A0A6L2MXT0_TANCI|nr:hypothetical protein [Tanacetum cinerariifolium]